MKAAAIAINLETGDCKWTVIDEGYPHGGNPLHYAQLVADTLRDDWPGYIWTYAADDEAAEAGANKLMKELGF